MSVEEQVAVFFRDDELARAVAECIRKAARVLGVDASEQARRILCGCKAPA